jgi:hypothetical protein
VPLLTPQKPPPPDYYAANLRLLLQFVGEHYDDVLEAREQRFIDAFMRLSSDGQRLFARLISRKGPWIRLDRLSYREIDRIDRAARELEAAGLAAINPSAPADALLGLLTQAERRDLFPAVGHATKTVWIERCVSRYDDDSIRRRLAGYTAWIAVAGPEHLSLCQLLFFGDDRQDLSTFVLNDLGLFRFERYGLDRTGRLFADRAAVDRYRRLRRLAGLAHRLAEVPRLDRWLTHALALETHNRLERRQRDRTLNRLGQHFERLGEFDAALDCYGRSREHPSRERRARILTKLGDACGAERLTARMARAPRCAEEVDFASRFGQRRRKAAEPVTEIPLHGAPAGAIEAHAADRLSANGGAVFHLENALPLGLAGLAFWDVMFADVPGAFTNPFQTAPLDLFWPDFAAARQAAIDARTAALSRPGALAEALTRTYHDKQGIANRLVSWRHFDETVLTTLLDNVPSADLLALAGHVIRWPYRTRTGFPDLTVVYGPNCYEFVEVKGPTDALQPAQRVWLKALADMGLAARVLKFRTC